ncbi:cupin domain-containing protein [Urechidicola croceus]|uniref:Cupin n=1 Tax=Urechidicola croceus TaxID=1850246 RepID=A0A1D8P7X1_9FLAO|nr:cupin [Urechidicola croceus]AOW20660.1 cupin [Urechidicola croceus]
MKTASIYKDIECNENKPVISVLLETTFTKEIRIVMKKGVSMKKHQTPFPIVIEIVIGNIAFGVNEKILNLEKGDIIALEGKVAHDLKAKEDSIIRLTLTKNDEASRVKHVINN